MDKEVVVHIYNGILLSHKKEHIWANSNEVDDPRAYYTYLSKSKTENESEMHLVASNSLQPHRLYSP